MIQKRIFFLMLMLSNLIQSAEISADNEEFFINGTIVFQQEYNIYLIKEDISEKTYYIFNWDSFFKKDQLVNCINIPAKFKLKKTVGKAIIVLLGINSEIVKILWSLENHAKVEQYLSENSETKLSDRSFIYVTTIKNDSWWCNIQ